MAHSGCESDARATEELFIRNFTGFEYIVIPSGSCTHHVRNKFIAAPLTVERENVRSHTYDIVEFLHDVMQVKEFPWAEFRHKVALHTSCSAIRGIFMQCQRVCVAVAPQHAFARRRAISLIGETETARHRILSRPFWAAITCCPSA